MDHVPAKTQNFCDLSIEAIASVKPKSQGKWELREAMVPLTTFSSAVTLT